MFRYLHEEINFKKKNLISAFTNISEHLSYRI